MPGIAWRVMIVSVIRIDRQRAARDLPLRHPHPPVRGAQLPFAARTGLIVDHDEQDAVLHERPGPARGPLIERFRTRLLRERRIHRSHGEQSRERRDHHANRTGTRGTPGTPFMSR